MSFYFSEAAFDEILRAELTNMVVNSPILYKYMNIEIGIKALQDHTLAFTQPLAFNDPYDCTTKFIEFDNLPENYREYLVKQYFGHLDLAVQNEKLAAMYKTPDEFLTKTLSTQGMANEIKNRGVTCFSKNFNNLLMWAHYAASHTGICIGFNLEKLYLNISELSSEKMMVQVDYQETFTSLNYYRHKRESIIRWLKTKAKIWSYEEEIRIIMNHLDFKGDTKFIQSIDKGCFHVVYLGTRITKENETTVIELCQKHYPEINLYKITPEDHSFDLSVRPLNLSN